MFHKNTHSKKILINFLVPIETHEAFDAICDLEGRSRTSVLVSLMTGFIASEGQRIIDDRRLRNRLREITSEASVDTDDRVETTTRGKQVKSMRNLRDDEIDHPLPPLIDNQNEGEVKE